MSPHRTQPTPTATAQACPAASRGALARTATRSRSTTGNATLEWLLVIAAAGGFAAAMIAGLDRLAADSTAIAAPDGHTHAAPRIAGARINDRALAALLDMRAAQAAGKPEQADAAAERLKRLRRQCEALPDTYPDAVRHARWQWQHIPAPSGTTGTDPQPNADENGSALDQPGQPDRTAGDGRWTCRLGAPAR